MFPSIFMLPAPMVGLAAYNRICGPMQTIRVCDNISRRILGIVGKRRPILPEDVRFELSVVNRLMPHRLAACLELSCAMQIWLALHGNESHVVVGKRVENSQFFVHAWLETSVKPFFFDDRFVPVVG